MSIVARACRRRSFRAGGRILLRSQDSILTRCGTMSGTASPAYDSQRQPAMDKDPAKDSAAVLLTADQGPDFATVDGSIADVAADSAAPAPALDGSADS